MHAERTALKPFVHTGNSANIAYYREDVEKRPSGGIYVWCEVLRSDIERDPKTKEIRRKAIPDFYFTVYRNGNRLVYFTYTPKTRPSTENLSTRTVGRLVREALA